jgi:transposase
MKLPVHGGSGIRLAAWRLNHDDFVWTKERRVPLK